MCVRTAPWAQAGSLAPTGAKEQWQLRQARALNPPWFGECHPAGSLPVETSKTIIPVEGGRREGVVALE
jgi:hypothetical protein